MEAVIGGPSTQLDSLLKRAKANNAQRKKKTDQAQFFCGRQATGTHESSVSKIHSEPVENKI